LIRSVREPDVAWRVQDRSSHLLCLLGVDCYFTTPSRMPERTPPTRY